VSGVEHACFIAGELIRSNSPEIFCPPITPILRIKIGPDWVDAITAGNAKRVTSFLKPLGQKPKAKSQKHFCLCRKGFKAPRLKTRRQS